MSRDRDGKVSESSRRWKRRPLRMHKRRGTRDIRPGRKGLEAKAIRRGPSELRRIGDPEDSGVGNVERWEHSLA